MEEVPFENLPVQIRRTFKYDAPMLDDYAAQKEQEYGLPSGWLRAIKNAGERSGSAQTSPAGASGVMQFMPGTAKRFGLRDASDPLAAIDAAGKYGAVLKEKFGGDPIKMAAAYNAGENHSGFRDPANFKPETVGYMDRVSKFLGAQQPPAHEEVPLENIPHLTAPLAAQQAKARELYSPVERGDGTFLDNARANLTNAAAGAGKSVADTVQGVKQMFGAVPQSEVDERARLDAPLMNTGAGTLGNVGGQLAQTYLASRLAPAGLGAVAAANPTVAAALGSAAFSGAQPVTSGDNRATNAAIGGGGALLGQGLVSGAKALVRPAWDGLSGSVTGLAKRAIAPASQGGFDIPLRAAQISNSAPLRWITDALDKMPFSAGGTKLSEQRSAYTRALAKTMGQDTDDLGEALVKARPQLKANYDTLEKSNNAVLTPQHVMDMADAANAVHPYDVTQNKSQVTALHDLLQHYIDTAHPATGEIPGPVFAALRKDAKAAANAPSTIPKAAEAYRTFQAKLEDAFRNGTSGNSADFSKLLGDTDRQWANMKTLEKLAPSDASGTPDVKKLASIMRGDSAMNSTNKNAFTYGSGNQDLSDLARIGTRFLSHDAAAPGSLMDRIPSGVRQAASFASVPATAGGLYYLNKDSSGNPIASAAAETAALLGGGRLLGKGLNSAAFARGSPALTALIEGVSRRGAGLALPAYVNSAKDRVTPPGGLEAASPSFQDTVDEVPLENLTGVR